MKIRVDDIYPEPKELRFSESIETLNEVYAKSAVREYRFPPALAVDLTYYRAGRQLFFHGRLRGTLQAACGRCLQSFPVELNKEFEFILTPRPVNPGRGAEELNRDDLGLSYYSTEEIDLSPLISEQVILALPTRPLCAEDCRGICGGCGANLNAETCACSSSAGDPRMAIFRTLKVGR
jgi:uncharacterized protein